MLNLLTYFLGPKPTLGPSADPVTKSLPTSEESVLYPFHQGVLHVAMAAVRLRRG